MWRFVDVSWPATFFDSRENAESCGCQTHDLSTEAWSEERGHDDEILRWLILYHLVGGCAGYTVIVRRDHEETLFTIQTGWY